MDERPTVIVAELSKEFDNKYVFKNMNFVLEDNEIIAIIGPSGCGKSTLLRMISGLETIEKGKVETANIEKNSIGYIFQKPVLYPHLNVEGNIALGISEKLSRRQRKVLIETELRTV